MKIDKTTYDDRKERQIGMTADLHFLFLKFTTQMTHCLLPDTQAIALQKSKSQIFLNNKKVNIQIQCLKLNSYGNN